MEQIENEKIIENHKGGGRWGKWKGSCVPNNKPFDGRFNGRTEWNIAPGH